MEKTLLTLVFVLISVSLLAILDYTLFKSSIFTICIFILLLICLAEEYGILVNKPTEQLTLIEDTGIILLADIGSLIILYSTDINSIYLNIALKSINIYIISSIHRNSESFTGSALTYFLLAGFACYNLLIKLGKIIKNNFQLLFLIPPYIAIWFCLFEGNCDRNLIILSTVILMISIYNEIHHNKDKCSLINKIKNIFQQIKNHLFLAVIIYGLFWFTTRYVRYVFGINYYNFFPYYLVIVCAKCITTLIFQIVVLISTKNFSKTSVLEAFNCTIRSIRLQDNFIIFVSYSLGCFFRINILPLLYIDNLYENASVLIEKYSLLIHKYLVNNVVTVTYNDGGESWGIFFQEDKFTLQENNNINNKKRSHALAFLEDQKQTKKPKIIAHLEKEKQIKNSKILTQLENNKAFKSVNTKSGIISKNPSSHSAKPFIDLNSYNGSVSSSYEYNRPLVANYVEMEANNHKNQLGLKINPVEYFSYVQLSFFEFKTGQNQDWNFVVYPTFAPDLTWDLLVWDSCYEKVEWGTDRQTYPHKGIRCKFARGDPNLPRLSANARYLPPVYARSDNGITTTTVEPTRITRGVEVTSNNDNKVRIYRNNDFSGFNRTKVRLPQV